MRTATPERPRVLYSFPHRIGAGRICETAWQQVAGVARAGADVVAHPVSVERPLPAGVAVAPTLARGKAKVPFRLVGHRRVFAAHDRIVARRLAKLGGDVDVVHVWPSGALETLRVARRRGIPTVLERPNTHPRFGFEIVRRECERLGVDLPHDYEHAYDEGVLRVEEEEFALADFLLCPSDAVVESFVQAGFPGPKLLRHLYGYDDAIFFPPVERSDDGALTVLFVGLAAVRKGLHFALDAWIRSPAARTGTFLVAGSILPAYERALAPMLAHASVRVLGHRDDVPELMRRSDVLVLPSLEEGSALVCSEAIASGCVPLVSSAASGVCVHGVNALVHEVGDVDVLASHLALVDGDRTFLRRLREQGIAGSTSFTWTAAGERLLDLYRTIAAERGARLARPAVAAPAERV